MMVKVNRCKSLKNANAQQTNFGLMAVLQRTVKPRVVAEYQTTTCLQATSAQWTDHGLMVVLQRTTMSRVVASWQTYLGSQATSALWANYGPMAVLQQTKRPRFITRPQVVGSPITKDAYLYKWYPPQEGGSAEDSPNKREVETIFGGTRKVENSQHARDKYTREAKAPPYVTVQSKNSSSPMGTMPKQKDIVFTETDASWVHHPYEDALVITAKLANSLIHRC